MDSPYLSDAQKAAILDGTAATLLGIAAVRCPIVRLWGRPKIFADDGTSVRPLAEGRSRVGA
jgi:hypothetical protein